MAKEAKEKSIFIASSPNTEKDDLRLARKLLFTPWNWRTASTNSARSRMRTAFASYHHTNSTFLYNTGRGALYEILKSIEIKEGDEVILQAFTCVAVPTAIVWAQATPVYVDITADSYNTSPENVQKAITPRTRGIIVQHTFGELSRIDEIRKIVDEENSHRPPEHKIYLIEDCAHTIGAQYKGRRVGEWGDAAFFSFGQEKVISCTQGGAAIAHDETLSERLSIRYSCLPEMKLVTIKRMILHPLLWSMINTLYYVPSFTGTFTVGRALILLFRALQILKPHVEMSPHSAFPQADIRMLSNAQSALLELQWSKLERFNKHRIELVQTYNSLLPHEHHVENHGNPLIRFPLQLKVSSKIQQKAKSHHIILGNWYRDPIHPNGSTIIRYGYKVGSCPLAEELTKQMINLPTHQSITVKDSTRITDIIALDV